MYQLKRKQIIKADLETCWAFFSSPYNLKKITPTYMGFEVLTDIPEKIHEGLMIEYRVKPLLGIPFGILYNGKKHLLIDKCVLPYRLVYSLPNAIM